MQSQHINPEEAALIHEFVKAENTLGVHWGTYEMGSNEVCALYYLMMIHCILYFSTILSLQSYLLRPLRNVALVTKMSLHFNMVEPGVIIHSVFLLSFL